MWYGEDAVPPMVTMNTIKTCNYRICFLRHLVMMTLILCFVMTASAQSQPRGEFLEKRNEVEGGYNFWVFAPDEYNTDKHPLPLIVFLHGASLCGNNLQKVRRYGVLDAIDQGLDMPMFVLAPQNPGGSWSPRKINDLIDWMEQNYAIDTTRIFVLGMSLGGYGTLDFVGTYPEKVAAAMALCGGTTLKDVSGMGKLPLWIMHGTADRAVNIRESKKIVDSLIDAGNDRLLRYDWFKGASHGALARVFYMRETYDWLLSHSTADKPRTLDTDIEITMEGMRAAYKDLKDPDGDYDEF